MLNLLLTMNRKDGLYFVQVHGYKQGTTKTYFRPGSRGWPISLSPLFVTATETLVIAYL